MDLILQCQYIWRFIYEAMRMKRASIQTVVQLIWQSMSKYFAIVVVYTKKHLLINFHVFDYN